MVHGRGGGVYQKQRGECTTTPPHIPPALFGLLELNRTARDAPAGRDWTGATPPAFWGGRSRRIYPCGKAPTTACGRDDDERRAPSD